MMGPPASGVNSGIHPRSESRNGCDFRSKSCHCCTDLAHLLDYGLGLEVLWPSAGSQAFSRSSDHPLQCDIALRAASGSF